MRPASPRKPSGGLQWALSLEPALLFQPPQQVTVEEPSIQCHPHQPAVTLQIGPRLVDDRPGVLVLGFLDGIEGKSQGQARLNLHQVPPLETSDHHLDLAWTACPTLHLHLFTHPAGSLERRHHLLAGAVERRAHLLRIQAPSRQSPDHRVEQRDQPLGLQRTLVLGESLRRQRSPGPFQTRPRRSHRSRILEATSLTIAGLANERLTPTGRPHENLFLGKAQQYHPARVGQQRRLDFRTIRETHVPADDPQQVQHQGRIHPSARDLPARLFVNVLLRGGQCLQRRDELELFPHKPQQLIYFGRLAAIHDRVDPALALQNLTDPRVVPFEQFEPPRLQLAPVPFIRPPGPTADHLTFRLLPLPLERRLFILQPLCLLLELAADVLLIQALLQRLGREPLLEWFGPASGGV